MSDILNKMRIKSFLIIPLILVLLLLSTPKVFAEELQNNSFTDKQQKLQENREKSQERMQNLQEKKEQLQKITEERKQKKQEQLQARCETLGKRIDTRIAKYNNNKERNERLVENLKEKLEKLIDKLKNKGYDTTLLEQDLIWLNNKYAELGTLYAAFIRDLEETKNFTCGESQEQYRQSLIDAKNSLVAVNRTWVDIRHYYQTQVRPHVQQIKEQEINKETSEE